MFYPCYSIFFPSTSSTTTVVSVPNLPVDTQHNQCPCRIFYPIEIRVQAALWSQNSIQHGDTHNTLAVVYFIFRGTSNTRSISRFYNPKGYSGLQYYSEYFTRMMKYRYIPGFNTRDTRSTPSNLDACTPGTTCTRV